MDGWLVGGHLTFDTIAGCVGCGLWAFFPRLPAAAPEIAARAPILCLDAKP